MKDFTKCLCLCQVLYVFMGAVAGYISARLYKSKLLLLHHSDSNHNELFSFVAMGGLRWKSNVLMTAFLVPG